MPISIEIVKTIFIAVATASYIAMVVITTEHFIKNKTLLENLGVIPFMPLLIMIRYYNAISAIETYTIDWTRHEITINKNKKGE